MKPLLLIIIAVAFGGCATEADPDRPSWDDAKKQLESTFGKDTPEMIQAKEQMQELSQEQDKASQNL